MERVKLNIISGDAAMLALASSASSKGLRGSVHSVFRHAVNIRLDGSPEIATLVSRALPDAPNTLVVDSPDFTKVELSADLPVTSDGGQVSVGALLLLDCGQAAAWAEPELNYPLDDARLRENMKHLYLEYRLIPGQDPASSQTLSVFAREASVFAREASAMLRKATADLSEALLRRDTTRAKAETRNILGLGLGFTPSGDDIMLGLLGSLSIKGAPGLEFKNFGRAVAQEAYQATNPVSATSVAKAAEGRLNSIISGFLHALMHLESPLPQLALRKVLQIGSSSGADIAYGLLKGMELNLALSRSREALFAG